MNKPYVKPSQMTKPPGMPWRQYRAMAESLDREWNHELHSNAAFMQLLDFTCARLAKARLTKSQIEASGPRLMLPKVLVVAGSRVVAKSPSAPGFARTRSSAEVQRAIARRIALR